MVAGHHVAVAVSGGTQHLPSTPSDAPFSPLTISRSLPINGWGAYGLTVAAASQFDSLPIDSAELTLMEHP